MTDTWQINKGLAETNLHMLDNLILCDVTFLLEERRQEVKAHKFMLVSRSPVFYAMFCGPVAESRDQIEILDIDKDSFSLLLRYLYTTECDITADSVMSLLYAGKKYQVEDLIGKCKTYLESEISTENVCVILQQAQMFDEQDLVKRCLEYIFQDSKKIFESSGFVSLKKEVLRLIIGSDELRCSEIDVYQACVHWAAEECRRIRKDDNETSFRDVLGVDLIKQIRFPCMDLKEFTNHVAKGHILTADEKVSVYIQLTTNNEENDTMFNANTRNFRTVRIERFHDPVNGTHWGFGNFSDAIKFQCSEDVSLIGVNVYTPSANGETKDKLEILDNTGNAVMSVDIKLVYENGVSNTDVLFDHPVRIIKKNDYTMTQNVSGVVSSFYGKDGQTTVRNSGIEVRFSNSTFVTSPHTNVNQGQFRVLLFRV